jgi:hypothetical protein
VTGTSACPPIGPLATSRPELRPTVAGRSRVVFEHHGSEPAAALVTHAAASSGATQRRGPNGLAASATRSINGVGFRRPRQPSNSPAATDVGGWCARQPAGAANAARSVRRAAQRLPDASVTQRSEETSMVDPCRYWCSHRPRRNRCVLCPLWQDRQKVVHVNNDHHQLDVDANHRSAYDGSAEAHHHRRRQRTRHHGAWDPND